MMKRTIKMLLTAALAGCVLLAAGCSQTAQTASSGSTTSSAASAASEQAAQSDAQDEESSASSAGSWAGVWEVTGLIQDGEELTGSELETELANNGFVMTLNEDGSMMMTYNDQTANGTWVQVDDSQLEITNTGNGTVETLQVDGDALVANLTDTLQGIFTLQGSAAGQTDTTSTDGNQDAAGLAGTWEVSGGIDADGTKYSKDEMIEEMGFSMEITIEEDGTFTATSFTDGEAEESVNGTWVLNGENISMTANDIEEVGTYVDGQLTLENEATITFEKK